MKLLGRTGKVAGQDVVVTDILRIGAALDNDFRVTVAGISRHHARVVKDGDAYWLEDAGSTNGTFLNGQRIGRERLRHLDVITLGRDVDLITVESTQGDTGSPPLPRAVEDAWLETVDARDGGRVDIPLGEITIGRLAPSNVLLDSPVVSHLHARIRRTTDHVFIQDLDSANGTFVNGAPVKEVTPLADGDTLAIAGSRHFRVHVVGNARVAKAKETASSQSVVFDPAWQTRLVWSADELGQLEAERRRILDSIRKEPAPAAAAAKPAVAPAPPKAAAPQAKAVVPPAPAKPAAPPAAVPSPAAPPVVAAPAKPAVPPAVPPVAKPAAVPAVTASPAAASPVVSSPPAPAGPVAAPVVPKDQVEPPKPVPPAVEKPVAVAYPPVAAVPPTPPVAAQSKPAPASAPAAPKPVPRPIKPAAPPPSSDDAVTIAASPFTAPTIISTRGIRLVKLTGDKGTFALEPGRHIVGRSDAAGVPILDPQVSRAHATISIGGLEARVEDTGSSNGTFVNGVRVTAGGVALKHGDRLAFGSLEFTVELVS